MTIDSATTSMRVRYVASAAQTTFAVPFPVYDAGDLKVYRNGTLLTYDVTPADETEYSIGAFSAASTDIVLGSPGATAADDILILNDIPVERTTDFATSGVFPIAALNAQLDKITAMVREREEEADDRSLHLAATDFPEVLSPLPVRATRVSRLFGFDADGQPTTYTPDGSVGSSVSADEAAASAAAALVSETNAAASETAAGASETAAGASAAAAAQDATDAETAETGAVAAEAAALASQNAAAASQAAALASANTASTQASAASTSAGNAATSASNASASAAAALASETAADLSEVAAAASETAAGLSETAADSSETAAAGSASAASSSATAASGSATAASGSASAASSSASAASTSASNAGTSETNAAASATSAAASYDSFDDRYLGTKAADPTLDNDGMALLTGALYFNTVSNEMKAYNGATWQVTYNPSSSAVDSVNGATGVVVLDADDIDDAATTNKFATAAEISKLAAIEALADVTDATNVAAAGALMDSEVTDLAGIKALATATILFDADIGSTVQAYDADTLKADTADQLTAGFTAAVDDDGTQSSGTYTPTVAAGSNYKKIVNAGAFTLAPPSAANNEALTLSLLVVNASGAGAITTSGFTKVTGDSFTTTITDEFLCRIEVFDIGGTEYSHLDVVALQ